MAVGMQDIAREAGVSVSTVGRVLHGNGYVSADARSRIERVIDMLGYVPDRRARALRTRSSGLIGSLVMPVENGLYRRINISIADAVHRAGREVVTMETRPDGSDIESVIENFIGLRIDALVVTSCIGMTDALFARLAAENIPVVCVERTYPGRPCDGLAVDDAAGLENAVARATTRGHRRIAYIGKPPERTVERERLAGYERALNAAGIDICQELIRFTDSYEVHEGAKAAAELFRLKDPPTAVFTGADTLAAGVMQTLYGLRLRVPEDVSVCGCDDMVSASLAPPVDSVALRLENIGNMVMELLTQRMADSERPFEERLIHTRYVDRGTVRAPKGE